MVRRVCENDINKYYDFFKKTENSHFLQSLEWKDFKNAQKSFALICEDDDEEVIGVMLMFVQKVRRTDKIFLYAPRGPVCSRDNTKALSELLAEAEVIAKEIGAYKLTLDPDITLENNKPWLDFFDRKGAEIGENSVDNAVLQPVSVCRLDVNKPDDELMAVFSSEARRNICEVLKSGATCREGTRKDIPSFCRFMESTAKRNGIEPRKEEYFSDMLDAFGEDMFKLFIVEYDGKPIAGSLLIACAGKSWHMYAGSDDETKEKMFNFLMQWEMMRWSRDHGYYVYEETSEAEDCYEVPLVSFVGGIDIIYDKMVNRKVKAQKKILEFVRKLFGTK